MKILRSAAVASMIAVVALALTGCSKADDTTTAKTPADQEEAQFVKYVNCLQQHGIKASYTEDAQGKGHFSADSGPNDPKFQAAQQACAQYVPQEMKKSVSPAQLDVLVKVAACMRQQGISVKDPTADDPGLHISGGDADSSKADSIRATCQQQVQAASPAS